jgi:hypothetical protein
MKRVRILGVAAALAYLGALGTTTVGCGSAAGSICDVTCDCRGCSESDYDECIDEYEDFERESDARDCLPEFDEYVGCIEDEIECRDGRVDADGCNTPFERWLRCMD